MIDKSLSQHYKDLLASRRSNSLAEGRTLAGGHQIGIPMGTRTGFRNPGEAGGPDRGGGSSNAGDRGGRPHQGWSAPAPAPAPAPSPHRNVVTTAVAPPSVLSGPTTTKPAHLGDTGFVTPTEPTRFHSVDTPTQIKEQIDLDKAKKERETKFKEDWGFEDTKVKAPKVLKPKTVTYDKGNPFTEKLIPTTVGQTLYNPKTSQNALLKRGSGIGNILKNVALGVVAPHLLAGTKLGTGLSLYNKYQAAKKYFPQIKNIETALKSNLTSTIDKGADLRSRPKGMPEHLGERGFRTRDDTPSRDRDGVPIHTAITGEEGLLTKGAETLGITEDQREQYKLMQNKMQTVLGQGSYTNEQGETIQLNEQQLDQLQKYIDNLDNILGTVLQTAAYGGRIGSPLVGGSKYI